MKSRSGTASLLQWMRRRRRLLLVDGAFAAVTVAVQAGLTMLLPAELRSAGVMPTLVANALFSAPIVVRRAAPRAAVAACLVALATAALAGLVTFSPHVGIAVVAYTTASRFTMRAAVAVTALLWPPLVAATTVAENAVPRTFLIGYTTLLALVLFLLGRTVHGHRTAHRVLQERAAATEANVSATARHAVADERRRIARELHDVVAHHVSVIGVMATGARRVLRRDPDAADEALQTIADTSRTTLREMRRLLDVLRTDDDPGEQLTPQPGLAGIEALVEQVREAGLPVRLRVRGTPVPLEAGVALTVYRIVQEALTNTLKHAGTATASVEFSFDPDGLTLQVSDTGLGPVSGAGAGVGHGLVGMRERVALYGGSLRTGARSGGGFTVQARIPADQLGAEA